MLPAERDRWLKDVVQRCDDLRLRLQDQHSLGPRAGRRGFE